MMTKSTRTRPKPPKEIDGWPYDEDELEEQQQMDMPLPRTGCIKSAAGSATKKHVA